MDPLIITVAPNGARRTHEDHPALPMTPEESATVARACLEAGAAMIHLHARDEEGRHTLEPAACMAASDAVTAATGGRLMVQMTSEAAGIYNREDQIAAVRAVMPDAVSLAVREIVPDQDSEPQAQQLFADLVAHGVRIQFIVYSPQELSRLSDLFQRGIVPDGPRDVLFVLGAYSGRQAVPEDLTGFLSVMSENSVASRLRWAVCAFGEREFDCMVAAIEKGGHVRVGFENNMALATGEQAPDNAALVRQVAEAAKRLQRPIADISAFY